VAGSSGTGRAQRRRCLPHGPLGGSEVRQGAAAVRARCRADGGPDVAWLPSGARGQSSGDAASAAALTGPRAAAQTGIPFRPFVRESVVGWTPRRHRLGGVSPGGAVDDGGVGPRPRPARPHDPAASGPCRLVRCRRRGQGSLGHRSGARHGRRPPRCASGWQRQRGLPRAAAWANHGGWDRARASACANKLSTRAGENGAHGRPNCCRQWGLSILPAGEAGGGDGARTDRNDDPDRA